MFALAIRLFEYLMPMFVSTRKEVFKSQSCHHIENRKLIYRANQWNGFYIMPTLALMSETKF